MGRISVNDDFKTLCKNIKMSETVVRNIQSRYHAITKRINTDFWNITSDTAHSLYVGSYGRGTCIYSSDIDAIVELPWDEYQKYDAYSNNGQSALLGAVRSSLAKTYSMSKIGADGQVVDISFSDGVTFEIVPSFKYSDGSYCYPDTHNGGSWQDMNPKTEISAFNGRNQLANGNLKRLCQMLRAWKDKNVVLMNGILLDTIAYRFMQNYKYAAESYVYYDWLSRDCFKYIYENADKDYWLKPGSSERVYKQISFKRNAKQAYELSVDAINAATDDYYYTWHDKWRKIYGTKFPSI